MDPITLGTLILAWFLKGAWDAFIAQAGSETRRAQDVIIRHVHDHRVRLDRRLAAARRNRNLSSGWWWAAAAVASWRTVRRGMKGGRPGATAVVSNSPWRRLWNAVWAGGRRRVRQGRKAWQPGQPLRTRLRNWWGNRKAYRAARPQPHGWRRYRPRWQRRTPAQGACDRCGALCDRRALAEAPSPSGGTWLICMACLAALNPKPSGPPPPPPPPPWDAPDPVTFRVPLDPADAVPPPDPWDAPDPVTYRVPLDPADPPVTGWEEPLPEPGEVLPSPTPPVWPKPAGWDDPPAAVPAGASTVSPERPYWLRFLDSPQGSEAAGRGLVLGFTSPENRAEYVEHISMEALTAGGQPFKEGVDYDVGGPASAPGNGHPASQTQIPESGAAPVPQLTNGNPGGNGMANGNGSSGGLAVRNGGGVAQGSGEAYNHGTWQQSYNLMGDCLAELPKALDGVLGDLRSRDVGRSQAAGMIRSIDGTRAWGVGVAGTLATVDPLALPVVEAVTAAGGPVEVNGMRYYEEV